LEAIIVPGDFSKRNVFAIFFVLGLAIDVILVAVWLTAEVIWFDFLHHNPNRSQQNALMMIGFSPIYGIFAAFSVNGLPRLVGGIGAEFSNLLSGRVPFRVLLGLVPICGYACFLQSWYVFPFLGAELPFTWTMAFRLALFQVPALLGCWAFNCRPLRRVSLGSP